MELNGESKGHPVKFKCQTNNKQFFKYKYILYNIWEICCKKKKKYSLFT